MVGKRELNRLDMSLEEYFDYILWAKNRDDKTLAQELFNDLSEKQKKEFFEYTDTLYFYEVDDGELVSEMIDFRKYFTN